MEKKINLNKFDNPKDVKKYPPFDENAYIQALCKHLLENLSATVAKKKAEKGLKNKELIQARNLTPSIEDGLEDGRAVTNLLNCQIVKSRNPWLVSDANLETVAKNLDTTAYKLLWDNDYTTMGLSKAKFKTSHYIKSGHHINPVALKDLFRFGINYLLYSKNEDIVTKALELYGPYTFATYFEPSKIKVAKELAIEFIFEDVKGKFLAEQETVFKTGSTFKLNKQLREFFEINLVNLLKMYVESAPHFALKLVEVMKGANELAESVRRGKEESEEAGLPVNEFDEAYSVIEKFAIGSENLLKLLVNEQNENMIDQNTTIKSNAKYFGEDKEDK